MSARGEHGWPDAGMAQTRIVAPASGMPRVLKTMSSLREPCACAGATMPGHTCSASVRSAHKDPIAIFDRIIAFLLTCSIGIVACAVWRLQVVDSLAQPRVAVLLCRIMFYERNLPHWHPEGRAIFLTWRLYGSLPENVLAQLKQTKDRRGRQFARAEQFLDKGAFGPLWLRNPDIARIVQASLLKGFRDLNHYTLLAYVLMPNHVHVLFDPFISVARITNGIKGV